MVCTPPHSSDTPSFCVKKLFFQIIYCQIAKRFVSFFSFLFLKATALDAMDLATGFHLQVPQPQLVVTIPTTVVLGVTCLAAPLS